MASFCDHRRSTTLALMGLGLAGIGWKRRKAV
ncbi:MAG: PEP-CTERM sorting domain-containing protein [Gammaproteobacteria bacterium]|nr:PEP-CTERM sorting domain-containing protein [Gammaproteobacteria bacterium]